MTVSYTTLEISQICHCETDADCDDDLFCNGTEVCNPTCVCSPGIPACPDDGFGECSSDCDEDADVCRDYSLCDEAYALTHPTECSVEGSPCASLLGGIIMLMEDGYYQPPAGGDGVTIKNKICLDNPEILVGGIQFDLCDGPDCLKCIYCELTERTIQFDCSVLELPNGCCRVILFCKNPGCAINPGLCNIVTLVMQTREDAPDDCGEVCIEEGFTNIVVSDYDGYPLKAAGISGELCPVTCGDVCPPNSSEVNDCGDGVVDIYDVMCEVDFALTATMPNLCQRARVDVPTGTPPWCENPDGCINILDIMVLIDMALNRQDCCTFYYTGVIY